MAKSLDRKKTGYGPHLEGLGELLTLGQGTGPAWAGRSGAAHGEGEAEEGSHG